MNSFGKEARAVCLCFTSGIDSEWGVQYLACPNEDENKDTANKESKNFLMCWFYKMTTIRSRDNEHPTSAKIKDLCLICMSRFFTKKIPASREVGIVYFLKAYSQDIDYQYPMPPISGAPPWVWGSSFLGLSATTHSVVRSMPAMDAAFSRATRLTLVGSITPTLNMFS